VAPELPIERLVLLTHGVVTLRLTPGSDCREATPQAFTHRPHVNREASLTASGRHVREAEEVEGGRFRPTRPLRFFDGAPPELEEPGFLRMERQTIFRKPLVQHLEDLFRVLLILKAENEVIRITDFVRRSTQARAYLLLEPFVQNIVEVYIG